MGDGGAEFSQLVMVKSYNEKVHGVMCQELANFVGRLTNLLPSIEAAQPGGASGVQALCLLNCAIDKAKLLLEYCAESSRLYLAMTSYAVMLRFERTRDALDLHLSQIQNMVPRSLVVQISEMVKDLRGAKFICNSSEQEAGRIIRALLQHDKHGADSSQDTELKSFGTVALSLKIATPKAFLLEKRALKKLLQKVHDSDVKKARIVKYLLDLLRKYEKLAGCEQTEDLGQQSKRTSSYSSMESLCSYSLCENGDQIRDITGHEHSACFDVLSSYGVIDAPPDAFICPISSQIMSDPVVIASGQTYERLWIVRWFSEGRDTCPKTQKKLPHLSLTPNSFLKELISDWCGKYGVTIPDPCSQTIPPVFSSRKNSMSSSIYSSSTRSDSHVPASLLNSDYTYSPTPTGISKVSISSSSDANLSLDSSQAELMEVENVIPLVEEYVLPFTWDDNNYQGCHSPANYSHGMYVNFLSELALLPRETQCKAVKGVLTYLEKKDEESQSILSNDFLQAVVRFVKDAFDVSDVNAQQTGVEILLAFVSTRRQFPCFDEDTFQLFTTLVCSKLSVEAMKIIQSLLTHRCCHSKILASDILVSIMKVLDSQAGETLHQAIQLLYELSSDVLTGMKIISLGFISKLIPLLGDCDLAGSCIKMLLNLCSISEEANMSVAKADGCIAYIIELIDNGTHDHQEHALVLLFSLCSNSSEYCKLVVEEGVIPALVSASINSSVLGKETAMKLLLHLRDFAASDHSEGPRHFIFSATSLTQDSSELGRGKKPALNPCGFFRKRMSIFSRPKS